MDNVTLRNERLLLCLGLQSRTHARHAVETSQNPSLQAAGFHTEGPLSVATYTRLAATSSRDRGYTASRRRTVEETLGVSIRQRSATSAQCPQELAMTTLLGRGVEACAGRTSRSRRRRTLFTASSASSSALHWRKEPLSPLPSGLRVSPAFESLDQQMGRPAEGACRRQSRRSHAQYACKRGS